MAVRKCARVRASPTRSSSSSAILRDAGAEAAHSPVFLDRATSNEREQTTLRRASIWLVWAGHTNAPSTTTPRVVAQGGGRRQIVERRAPPVGFGRRFGSPASPNRRRRSGSAT